jgi:hypothetical protein
LNDIKRTLIGLGLGWSATLKKMGADYEQLLQAVFFIFSGPKK